MLLAACALSDLLDGPAARRRGPCSRFGAVFDMMADFALLFSLYLLYVLQGRFPPFLLLLITASALSFGLCCLASGRVAKQRLGCHTGALLTAGLLWLFLVRLFSPGLYARSLPVVAAVTAIGLLLSLAENLFALAKKKASPAGEARSGKPEAGNLSPPSPQDEPLFR